MNAIGWTLLHSLWQAFILGGIIFISFRLIGKNQAKSRYTAAALGMFSILLTAIITFTHYLSLEINKIHINTNEVFFSKEINFDFILQNKNIFNLSELEKFFPFIVNCWSIGTLLLCMHMLVSYYRAYRLKNKCAYSLSKENLHTALRLKEKLGIRKKILFKESGKIDVPCLIGYFKPVILLPVSMLSGIPNNQLEMIIAHELAHVYRHDYLFQTIQNIVEILFFYHPMVWWLSSVVKTEREHICDDLAVKICGESLTLIKALNNMETIRRKQHEMILGFPGKKENILKRAQRAIGSNAILNLKMNRSMMSGVFLVLFVSLLFISNIAISENKNEELNSFNYSEQSVIDNISTNEKELAQVTDNEKEIIISEENGKTVIEQELKNSSVSSHTKIISNNVNVAFGADGKQAVTLKNDTISSFGDDISIKLTGQKDSVPAINIKGVESSSILDILQDLKKGTNKPIYLRGKKISFEEFNKIPQNKIKSIDLIGTDEAKKVIGEEGKNGIIYIHLKKKKDTKIKALIVVDGKIVSPDELNKIPMDQIAGINHISDDKAIEKYGLLGENGAMEITLKKSNKNKGTLQINKKEKVSTTKDPLYIVDGKEMSENFNPQNIDPNKIESITVWKDSEAVEKYGKKGENGVISITTKASVKVNNDKLNKNVLYVIDGKKSAYNSFKNISSKDIESVTILKNETAIAIYGKEARNGVILINTKNKTLNEEIHISADSIIVNSSKKDNFLNNQNPLILLDGKRISKRKFKKIDSQKIESISIFKGKIAIEKFGNKAKNGVLKITSKK
jgi:TonB-dependent SusC/RagA subfamily outer membrane receptor